MKKYYEVCGRKFRIKVLEDGKTQFSQIDEDGYLFRYRFDKLEDALLEILSFSEIDEDDFA